MLGAGVKLQQKGDLAAVLGPGACPVRVGQPVPGAGPDQQVTQGVRGGPGFVQPLAQLPAVLAGMRGQGDEELVPAGHVAQPRGAFQAELPVGAGLRRPLVLVPVLDAEQGGADRAEHVVPGRGPGRRVRPEPAQQPEPDQRGQPVPGGGQVGEAERGELAGGQHPVLADQADQLPVAVGQVRGRLQQGGLVLAACPRARPARMRM